MNQSIVHGGTGEKEQNQITDQLQSKPHVPSTTNTAITMKATVDTKENTKMKMNAKISSNMNH